MVISRFLVVDLPVVLPVWVWACCLLGMLGCGLGLLKQMGRDASGSAVFPSFGGNHIQYDERIEPVAATVVIFVRHGILSNIEAVVAAMGLMDLSIV